MSNQSKPQAWILCAERLPEIGVPVLLSDCKQQLIGHRITCSNERGWMWQADGINGYEWDWDFDDYFDGDQVKYWQPLPPLPPNIFLETHCPEAQI